MDRRAEDAPTEKQEEQKQYEITAEQFVVGPSGPRPEQKPQEHQHIKE